MIKNLTNKFNGVNTILLYLLKSDSCYIIYWACILLIHKIPTTAGILLNGRKTSPSCVISRCVKSRYGSAEEFFFTFPFSAHSLVLGASLYLYFSPPPFLPPSSLLTLRCECLAPPVALTESCMSKTRFSSPMHQRGTAGSFPSHADKCARTNYTAINSHYQHRLRLKHRTVYFVQSYSVLPLLALSIPRVQK